MARELLIRTVESMTRVFQIVVEVSHGSALPPNA